MDCIGFPEFVEDDGWCAATSTVRSAGPGDRGPSAAGSAGWLTRMAAPLNAEAGQYLCGGVGGPFGDRHERPRPGYRRCKRDRQDPGQPVGVSRMHGRGSGTAAIEASSPSVATGTCANSPSSGSKSSTTDTTTRPPTTTTRLRRHRSLRLPSVLPSTTHGATKTSAKKYTVTCTHQSLVTLTVQTTANQTQPPPHRPSGILNDDHPPRGRHSQRPSTPPSLVSTVRPCRETQVRPGAVNSREGQR